jgi:hypothetical protein
MAHHYGRREFQPAVRQAALKRAYYRCEQCGARERLEFHPSLSHGPVAIWLRRIVRAVPCRAALAPARGGAIASGVG